MKALIMAACLGACAGFDGDFLAADFTSDEPCICQDEVGKFRTGVDPSADDFVEDISDVGEEMGCGIDGLFENDNRGFE